MKEDIEACNKCCIGRWIDLDIFSTAVLSLVPPKQPVFQILKSRCSNTLSNKFICGI